MGELYLQFGGLSVGASGLLAKQRKGRPPVARTNYNVKAATHFSPCHFQRSAAK